MQSGPNRSTRSPISWPGTYSTRSPIKTMFVGGSKLTQKSIKSILRPRFGSPFLQDTII